jgi:hypothetical protein
MSRSLGEQRGIITTAMVRAERAVEVDTEYWTEMGTGQDTEEAEASGNLCGQAEALRAVFNLLLYDDAKGVECIIESVSTTVEQQQMELEEFRAEPDPEDDPVGQVIIVIDGRSLIQALDKDGDA